jgi:hypothetical protein
LYSRPRCSQVPTGAGAETQTALADRGVVVAASSASGYGEWYEIESYRRRSYVADYLPGIPGANAYVFLDADPDRGVFVNPYITATGDGVIYRIPPEWYERLQDSTWSK